MNTYRAVMLTKRGGPETLQEVELPVREPGPGELRIRVRACGAGYAAQLRPGQSTLVTGANGGVGTALLELLRAHGCPAIGSASPKHHEAIRSLGATPIEARTVPLDVGVHAVLPEGVDVTFDALGNAYVGQCIRATKHGGLVVSYGWTAAIQNGKTRWLGGLRGYASLFLGAPLAGRCSTIYGIILLYRKKPQPFLGPLSIPPE